MTEEEKTALREASNRVRRERREARSKAEEAATLGIRGLMGARLEAEASALTERLRALALSEDDAIALRGIELWLSRVYGKAVQPTQEVSTDLPVDMDALRALSPDERRALLRSMPPIS
jgi:vacuolar-type H+-ATPase subunit E/Vma4